jgi:hypothetical protein
LLFIYPIQYQLAVDKFAHRPRQAPQFELQYFFGQVLRFLVAIVNIPSSLDHGIEAQCLAYAITNEIKVLDHETNLYCFYHAMGPTVIIDLNQVQCVIGQIFD